MRVILNFLLLVIYLTTTQSSVFTNFKDNIVSLFRADDEEKAPHQHRLNDEEKNALDIISAKNKVKMLRPRKHDVSIIHLPEETNVKKEQIKRQFVMDPVLNVLRRGGSASEYSESSSMELKDWKEEWKEQWIKKKIEAVNMTTPRGDHVNMIAARPWGKPCGDPKQHDMPWGSCMLAMECEAEYRIYRGDYFCGRTQFVCCALQLTAYDMYNAFDVSFDASEFDTDSDEVRNRDQGSIEKRRKRKIRQKRKRKQDRMKRKRKIKRSIRKIMTEIKKILNRSYRNGTQERKKKTKQLKRFIKDLKTQFKKERKAVKDLHEREIIKIDAQLQKRLSQIMGLNQNFISNSTFRDIVVNGTVNRNTARFLAKRYPDLVDLLDVTRRSGGRGRASPKRKDYLDYDVEYGLVYY